MVNAPYVKCTGFFISFFSIYHYLRIMKYTKFILKKDLINYNLLETNNAMLQPPFVAVMLVIGIAGLFIVGGLLPVTVTIDGCRIAKYRFIMFSRRKHRSSIVRKTIIIYRIFEQNNRMIVHGFSNVLKKIA